MKSAHSPPHGKHNMPKETRYCINLAHAECRENEYSYRIEKIYVKTKQQEEIRFAIYKQTLDKEGGETSKLIPRPLDVTEEELLVLLKTAISQEIFSKSFLKNLKSLISDTASSKIVPTGNPKTEVNST